MSVTKRMKDRIMELHKAGYSAKEIAEMTGESVHMVAIIISQNED